MVNQTRGDDTPGGVHDHYGVITILTDPCSFPFGNGNICLAVKSICRINDYSVFDDDLVHNLSTCLFEGAGLRLCRRVGPLMKIIPQFESDPAIPSAFPKASVSMR